ncbi:hypothetical protein AAOE16_10860 [Ekhidna sp. MALMAid0563]|uniref:hypothetical protein n=1 Tax=Ekhidna sp. MALMAid0563 TaxID=3143937 RepID=UPI0032DEA443
MKIVRINKGKVVNLPIRLVSAIIMVVITISLMDALPEPWSIFIAIALASFLPGIWFASYVIIINEEKKTIFDGIWTMGHKFGKPIKYESIEKIFINRVKTKQTMYSLSNRQNVVTDHEYRAYLKLDNGEKFYLLSHPLEETVEEKVTKIREKLGV